MFTSGRAPTPPPHSRSPTVVIFLFNFRTFYCWEKRGERKGERGSDTTLRAKRRWEALLSLFSFFFLFLPFYSSSGSTSSSSSFGGRISFLHGREEGEDDGCHKRRRRFALRTREKREFLCFSTFLLSFRFGAARWGASVITDRF